MDSSKIREKIGRFRILVIGRANAGKTTILQRICNTRDKPKIFNNAGKEIDLTVLTASKERGEHEIENEMVFESNPGFVFHDSRGFEAGSKDEFDKVKAFITDRSTQAKIAKRLHVIWFCIPMDEACRSFTAGEEKFFTECDTASIPVIVLFTKFDALYGIEFRKLIDTGTSRKDAKQQAPRRAEETFTDGPQLQYLKNVRWPPKCHVCLPYMNKGDADCSVLIEQTAGALDDEALKQLFVSTQQTNLEICMKYAIQR
ncbi:GTP-binding protein [Suillus tomentosus]|nr:GTP-binding protein [Suillus tomentosus]